MVPVLVTVLAFTLELAVIIVLGVRTTGDDVPLGPLVAADPWSAPPGGVAPTPPPLLPVGERSTG
jgi:hypothetical protein